MTDELNYGHNPPPPSNPAAIVAIIAGLLICIPGTGVIAIPAAAIGLRKAHRAGGTGLAPARVGLVLGIINLVWWTALLGGAFSTYRSFKLSEPAFEPTKKFIMLVGSGQVNDAKALCTNAVTEEQLTTSAEQIQQWGVIQNVNVNYGGEYHSSQDIEIAAELTFDKMTKFLVAHWAMVDGSPRLVSYYFRDPPTTQPATQSK